MPPLTPSAPSSPARDEKRRVAVRPGPRGGFFFGNFLLDKQKKVNRGLRAEGAERNHGLLAAKSVTCTYKPGIAPTATKRIAETYNNRLRAADHP